ncbi:MAG: hypothetical protein L0G27_09085 [Paracoccus sp. (in: a-proteobacteria)]|nr:hypothetical protein [Paracoccus sp. (in: a-proteobacteria)]
MSWHIEEGQVTLDWAEEYDSDQPEQGQDGGFGSVLLEGAAAQIGSELDIDQSPRGRRTRLRFQAQTSGIA